MVSNYNKSNNMIMNEAQDYIDGLVLSDGYIGIRKGRFSAKTSWYHQTCIYKSWLDKISIDFCKYNIISHIGNGRKNNSIFGINSKNLTYILNTNNYIEFKEMRDRWYKRDYNIDEYSIKRWHNDGVSEEYYAYKKIIPKDICLTPECVANWYMGDGNISKSRNQITLATNGFLKEDIIFISDLLSEVVDINCSVTKRNCIEIYNKFNIRSFIDYIKEFKVDCYLYKFPEKRMV